ncbi:helix-turn-helix domain-containing protein [Streptomyces sp. NPDC000133]|uniref:helix-turn-helix domain-containing protein n=1 Tax=Streptomyces sp. NPDC000133 TaxID=3364535 RepID=UPI00368D2926
MGRRYRLHPDRSQEQVLTRWGHAARTLWNIALEQRTYVFEQRGDCVPRSLGSPESRPGNQTGVLTSRTN